MFVFVAEDQNFDLLIPIRGKDRNSVKEIVLTEIGQFGIMRKARPNVPAHFHTGIDIKRPVENYENEPVFPITKGMVISIRNDGPYAQIIIVHKKDNNYFWTVYEHIAGIIVSLGENVYPEKPIARFMNKTELNKYGWKFNHIHFETLKIAPKKLKQDDKHPQRKFVPYTLVCYTQEDLEKYYYNPLEFLDR
ncbi:MAG: M23 family metallopeptidase [Bacteroidota bacterium]